MKASRLKVRVAVAAVAMVATLLGHGLIAQQPAAAIFERARMLEETASQNLSEAIQLYEQVAARASENRPLAAQAQVRIGVLYERLGRTGDARAAYEKVLSGHAAQQPAVVDARARLSAISGKAAVNTGPVARSLWTAPIGADIEGLVSPDGRYVPYGMANVLHLHDLTTRTDRRLTASGDTRDYVDETIFSRDGKQVAYAIDIRGNDRYQLRVVDIQAKDVTSGRLLFDDPAVGWIGPFDWSPDGRSIAVQLKRRDGLAQIGLLMVADGSLRVLKQVKWPTSVKVFFSPDGRYLAYDLPGSDGNQRRDVFVMAIDGGREVPVLVSAASDDTLVGWSPNGTHVLIASDRTGSTALWQVPFKDGVVMGQPELLKGDIGKSVPLGLSKAGALYFERLGGRARTDIHFAGFDLSTGRLTSDPNPAAASVRGSVAEGAPSWSADGKDLAYTTTRQDFGNRPNFVITIRAMETGEVRELVPSPAVSLFTGARWSPDQRSFVAAGTDVGGRSGVFRIDAQTGQATSLFIPQGADAAGVTPSPDGRFVYYRRHPVTGRVEIVKRELASGQEVQLIRETDVPLVGWLEVSPDGRFIATPTGVGTATSNTVLLIPTDGSGARTLPQFGGAGRASVLGWAPDSGSVYLRKDDRREGVEQVLRELWRVFLDGRAPIKLDTNLPSIGRAVVSPDGRQIAFHVNSPAKPSEVWVMENFLPPPRP
jgi:Tol biopolymer transport system component